MPECAKNLMPASPFIKKGCTIVLNDFDKVLLSANDGTPILSGQEINGLYFYKCKTVKQVTTRGKTEPCFFGLQMGKNIGTATLDFSKKLLETHWAYGHLNFDKLRTMLNLKKGDNPECPACTMATSRQTSLSKKMPNRSPHENHRMHLDIGFTRNCNHTFQLMIDDYSRKGYLEMLDNKSETLSCWITLKGHLEKKHAPWKFAFIRTDGESVYDSDQWKAHCKEEGLEHEVSGRYRHDQNGVVERAMQAIGVPFRCMMIQGCAPESDIPDALYHTCIIRNNSPTKANNGWTPNEKAAGMKLPINKRLLRGPLFCLVYAHVYEEERHKHAPRGVACVYLGYDDVNNTFKVKEWKSGQRYYTADLTFHPDTFPYRANPTRTPDWLCQYDDTAPHVLEGDRASDPRPHDTAEATALRRSGRQQGYRYSAGQALCNVPDVDVPPDAVNCALDFSNYMVHTFGPNPKTWDEAMRSPYANEWIEADLAEQAAFEFHKVLKIVPRTNATETNKKIFKPRPVMTIKINPPCEEHLHGSIEKFRFRLTCAAYTKMLTQGIDYKEKHASTVRWNSIKMLIAIAVHHDFDLVLYDISTFFLYGELTDEVYMEQPLGWEPADKPREDYITQVMRGMYGLPQAGHCAQRKLKETLTGNGEFKSSSADDCMFVGQDNYAIVGSHVDDLLATGTPEGLQMTDDTLTSTFKITRKRNPTVVTGVQIERNRTARWLKLHQEAYVNNLLAEYNMTDCHPASTPMDPGMARALMLLPTTPEDPEAQKLYQRLVGSLLWLPNKTRPDMMFTVNLLCRFLKNATRKHFELARGRPLRYLKGTVNYGLVFQPGDGEWVLSGASDSDLAGDLATSRSTSGFYAKMGEYGSVVCSSSLEKKVSTSTGQAETYAMQSLVKEVVWDRHLLSQLHCRQTKPTDLLTDNQGVLQQSTKAINHSTAKHYRIAQAYIRSKVDDQTIKVGSVHTSKNAADIFTKALHAPPFTAHRLTIMGPQQRPPDLD